MSKILGVHLPTQTKNLLINGNFDYFQRGFTKASAGLLADRWNASAGVTSQSRQVGGPDTKSVNFLRVSGTTGEIGAFQRVESIFSRQIDVTTLTLSVYLKVSTGSAVSPVIKITVPTAVDTYTAESVEQTKALTGVGSTWAKYTFTFPVSTLMKTNGFAVTISDTVSTSTAYDIAQACLVEGSSAAANFCRTGRDLAEELTYCQRYYEKSVGPDIAPFTFVVNSIDRLHYDFASASTYGYPVTYKTVKRINATVTLYNPDSGATGSASTAAGAVAVSPRYAGVNSFEFLAGGQSTYCAIAYVADAEIA